MIRPMKSRPDKEKFIKTKIAYFAHTLHSDKLKRPELFKLNIISFKEKFENVLVLLSYDSEQSTTTFAYLPNNQDVVVNKVQQVLQTSPIIRMWWDPLAIVYHLWKKIGLVK